MMNPEDQGYVHNARYLVWTDHNTHARAWTHRSGSIEAAWFWSASGPRGHQSGAEATAEAALDRARAAFMLVMGEHERNPPKAAA